MNIYTSEVEYLRDKVKQLEEALAKQEQGCEFCNHPLYVGTKCKNCGSAKQEQGEPDWKALVLNHNAECESRCNMDSCGYKPYFEYNKRRCPNCPVHEMIDVEYTTPQPAQKPWVGLTDEEEIEIIEKYMTALGLGVMFIDEVEAKLKEKNSA